MKTQTYHTTRITTVRAAAQSAPLAAKSAPLAAKSAPAAPRKPKAATPAPAALSAPAPHVLEIVGDGSDGGRVLIDGLVPLALAHALVALATGWKA